MDWFNDPKGSFGEVHFGTAQLGNRMRTSRLAALADRRLVDVADQGADTTEFLEHELRSGRRFVVRSRHDRILLTNEAVETIEDALRVIGWYECRWIVEEYHKAMKTGCDVEELQFTTQERLKPMIALLSVVALTLLHLRDASRRPDAKTRLATEVVSADYVEVLNAWRYGRVTADRTVHEFFYALARLGGHQNRKHDKQPGWLVLWRGWMMLHPMAMGANAIRRKQPG